MAVIFYIASIAAANILTARLGALILLDGLLILPVGSLFAGATFVLRDFVQIRHGKRGAYIAIFSAIALSAVISLAAGDTAHIAIASALSFLASEAVDTEIFSRMNRPVLHRIAVSGTVGSVVDSAIFVVIGLSPLGGNLLHWGDVIPAIFGQIIAKSVVQFFAVALILIVNKKNKNGGACDG